MARWIEFPPCGAVPGADLWPSDALRGAEPVVESTHVLNLVYETLDSLFSAQVLFVLALIWTVLHDLFSVFLH